MMETEIWPNLLRACRRDGVKTMLVNGRISSRSYPRYRLARPSSGACSPTSTASACRATNRRAASSTSAPTARRVTVTGTLKFDSLEFHAPGRCRPRPAAVPTCTTRAHARAALLPRRPARPVVIAASTLKGEEEPVLAAFQRIRATMTDALLDHRAAQARALRRGRALARRARLEGRAPHASCASTPSRAPTSSSSTRSASWRSCSRSRRSSSSAAASSTPAATISSSRRCTASRSCLVRTCRTSRRSRGRSSTTAPRSRCGSGRELETVAARAARRSGAPRQPRRGGARARRGQPRRARQEPRGDRASCCRRTQRGVVRPFRIVHERCRGAVSAARRGQRAEHALRGRRRAGARERYAARPGSAPPAAAPGRQRRQPRDGRAREDADRRLPRARCCSRRASGPRFSAAATAAATPRTASSS